VNELLEAQEIALERARHRAAEMAHGFKTPLTALAGDVARLRASNQPELADDIAALARQMRRIVERELARARRGYGDRSSRTALRPAIEAIARTLARTPAGERIDWDIEVEEASAVAIDGDDLNDVLGNLMENAARAARGRVRVRAAAAGERIDLAIADDGPSVDPAAVGVLVARGNRLDESGGSAGLGLAIVAEILYAHDTRPHFAKGDLGGLEVSFSLPAAQ